jgi:hypothetical protein
MAAILGIAGALKSLFKMIWAGAIVLVFLMVASSGRAQGDAAQKAPHRPQPQDVFRQSLQELVAYSPDPCDPPIGSETDRHSSAIESRLFDAAEGIVEEALNEKAAAARAPRTAQPQRISGLRMRAPGSTQEGRRTTVSISRYLISTLLWS